MIKDILDEAKSITDGRRCSYGTPEDSFYEIAKLWSSYIEHF